MLDRIVLKLKEKKLYELVLGIAAFLILLLLYTIFNYAVAMLLMFVFLSSRFVLKKRLKEATPIMLYALTIHITYNSLNLLGALLQSFLIIFAVELLLFIAITAWFYKRPSWKSGGLMIAYNLVYLINKIQGVSQALAERSIALPDQGVSTDPNVVLRQGVFGIVISFILIVLIVLAVKAQKKQLETIEAENYQSQNVSN